MKLSSQGHDMQPCEVSEDRGKAFAFNSQWERLSTLNLRACNQLLYPHDLFRALPRELRPSCVNFAVALAVTLNHLFTEGL